MTRFRDVRTKTDDRADAANGDAEHSGDGHDRTTTDRRERGVVIIWFALMLIALLGIAGFAVDLSNWWVQAQRLQKAADAGAHAGVVYLPGDPGTAASTARRELGRNSFAVTGANKNAEATINPEPNNPNRLRVSVSTKVSTYFVALLGVNEITLTRQAVAEFISPVPMGSPENKLGNDPEINDPGTQMWLNISAPNTGKEQGDKFHSKVCSASPKEVGCNGTNNDEYDDDGYFFSMKVSQVVHGQPLVFEVFDAAWVNNGLTCGENMPSSSQISTLAWTFPDAATRYSSQNYCAGDGHPGSTLASVMDTTFIVREPDNTPWTHLDNQVVNTATCKPVTVPGLNPAKESKPKEAIYNKLLADSVINPNDGVVTFAEAYRRFTPICTIPAGSVTTGEYIVQVRTNAKAAAPLVTDPSVSTNGHNKMSFRAGFGAAGAKAINGSSVTIAALGKLPIFANAKGADTRFYLARVLPYDAGRTLRILLFDMGESSNSGELQVLPPAEYGSTFTGCKFELDNGASLNVQPNQCKVTGVYSTSGNGYKFNGRQFIIDVPIPQNYTCSANLPTGCWIKMKVVYPSGATVNDATTWSAAILGNPVRLVE